MYDSADRAAVEGGDDPGREVVGVDEADAEVVERPIRQLARVGEADLLAESRERSPGP